MTSEFSKPTITNPQQATKEELEYGFARTQVEIMNTKIFWIKRKEREIQDLYNKEQFGERGPEILRQLLSISDDIQLVYEAHSEAERYLDEAFDRLQRSLGVPSIEDICKAA